MPCKPDDWTCHYLEQWNLSPPKDPYAFVTTHVAILLDLPSLLGVFIGLWNDFAIRRTDLVKVARWRP